MTRDPGGTPGPGTPAEPGGSVAPGGSAGLRDPAAFAAEIRAAQRYEAGLW